MLQALIITLREGVEAALIVGITLAYLNKIERNDLRKPVYAALVAAFAASVAAAVVIARLGLNTEVFEGWVMLVAAFFVVTMIVFMMKTARFLKGDIENKIGALAGNGSSIGLFTFIFLMVFREGVETVLILSAVEFNSTQLWSFLGTLFGVTLAMLFGIMFVKGSVRINLQKFFRVTTVILFFVAFQLLISGLHELSENGVLPSGKQEMAIIGPIVRNDFFFFITILALAGMMILMEVRRRAAVVPAGSTNADRRKAEWTVRRERMWMSALYGTSFVFIFLITAQFIYAKRASALSPATEVVFTNGSVSIPASTVSDRQLHRFQSTIHGTAVRFFLYQKPDGKIATLYDACEICGRVGFYTTDAGVICKNCGAPINPQTVGQPGGCNPIPLKSQLSGDNIIISEADLASGAHSFEAK